MGLELGTARREMHHQVRHSGSHEDPERLCHRPRGLAAGNIPSSLRQVVALVHDSCTHHDFHFHGRQWPLACPILQGALPSPAVYTAATPLPPSLGPP